MVGEQQFIQGIVLELYIGAIHLDWLLPKNETGFVKRKDSFILLENAICTLHQAYT